MKKDEGGKAVLGNCRQSLMPLDWESFEVKILGESEKGRETDDEVRA